MGSFPFVSFCGNAFSLAETGIKNLFVLAGKQPVCLRQIFVGATGYFPVPFNYLKKVLRPLTLLTHPAALQKSQSTFYHKEQSKKIYRRNLYEMVP